MQVTCPACQKTLQSKTDLSGKSVKCPCGHSFAVPKAAAAPAAATVSAAKISVSCSCGKTLQAPAAAAGKAVKCPCGQVVKVPAAASAPAQRTSAAKPVAALAAVGASTPAPALNRRPAVQPAALNAAPNPFGDMSDDEWKNMVQAHAPKQIDTSKPKEKSATTKMLEQARQETGVGNESAKETALAFLNKTRGTILLVGIGYLISSIVLCWLDVSMVNSLRDAAVANGAEPEEASILVTALYVYYGVAIGMSILFMSLAALISYLPMTCTITAIVLFTLVELLRLLSRPISLISPRDWIIRASIFGGLIQGINNAAYYRHLKAEEKAARRNR